MSKKSAPPMLIEGGIAFDDRGHVAFVNDFSFDGIKRMYRVGNFSLDTVRAWHGHMKESKYFYVASGSVLAAAVEFNDTKNPNKKNKVERFVLTAQKPSILFIPAGYANGFKSLEEGTELVVFSDASLDESKGDDYRLPHDYWGENVWEVENR